jgi:hypothetical protein
VNLGHSGPPINQRPSSSARSRRLARSAEAERTKDPPEPRCRHGGARHEQSFDPLKPEAGVARPLVELDPRHAVGTGEAGPGAWSKRWLPVRIAPCGSAASRAMVARDWA